MRFSMRSAFPFTPVFLFNSGVFSWASTSTWKFATPGMGNHESKACVAERILTVTPTGTVHENLVSPGETGGAGNGVTEEIVLDCEERPLLQFVVTEILYCTPGISPLTRIVVSLKSSILNLKAGKRCSLSTSIVYIPMPDLFQDNCNEESLAFTNFNITVFLQFESIGTAGVMIELSFPVLKNDQLLQTV